MRICERVCVWAAGQQGSAQTEEQKQPVAQRPPAEGERGVTGQALASQDASPRLTDAEILRRLAQYVWPRDNSEYTWRILAAMGLLVGAKVLNVAVSNDMDCRRGMKELWLHLQTPIMSPGHGDMQGSRRMHHALQGWASCGHDLSSSMDT